MYVYANRPEKHGWKTFMTVVITAVITVLVVKFVPNIVEGYNTQKQTNEEKYIDIPLDDDVEWDKYPLDNDEIFEYLIAENAVMYMANN